MDYIIDEVCIEPYYKDYGFVSIPECDKVCFPLPDKIIKQNRYSDLQDEYFKEQKKQRDYEREGQELEIQQRRYETERDYNLHNQQAEQMQRQLAEQAQRRQAYIESCLRQVDAEIEGRIADKDNA